MWTRERYWSAFGEPPATAEAVSPNNEDTTGKVARHEWQKTDNTATPTQQQADAAPFPQK